MSKRSFIKGVLVGAGIVIGLLVLLYLIEHGANIYLKDSFGYTVFERIQMHNHISKEIGELLVKKCITTKSSGQ